ncbi:MAG TPA: hypothetical protein VJ672_08905 [Gemmatimonadaceae bacterium]|nr:hypothetical protein [Gemmatimonadaceae bacterium]
MISTPALIKSTIIGTLLQLAMVLVGHSSPAVANMFAVGGMTISLLAGIAYALMARPATAGGAIVGGLLAGGICALLGIIVSYVLGDVTAMILVMGTASSAITGAFGGWLGKLFAGRKAVN